MRVILAAQVTAIAMTCIIVAASVLATWFNAGARVFDWRALLGPLCILVSVYDLGVIAWTITRERNQAVERFGEKEGKK